MAYENETNTIPRDETSDLISSAKVEGTAVYDRDDNRLGSIDCFMVGKLDGQVRYAVLSFGGLFGMGERYHPLPWDTLTYDTDKSGYVVNISKERLEGGPSYMKGEEPTFDRSYDRTISDYYLPAQ